MLVSAELITATDTGGKHNIPGDNGNIVSTNRRKKAMRTSRCEQTGRLRGDGGTLIVRYYSTGINRPAGRDAGKHSEVSFIGH